MPTEPTQPQRNRDGGLLGRLRAMLDPTPPSAPAPDAAEQDVEPTTSDSAAGEPAAESTPEVDSEPRNEPAQSGTAATELEAPQQEDSPPEVVHAWPIVAWSEADDIPMTALLDAATSAVPPVETEDMPAAEVAVEAPPSEAAEAQPAETLEFAEAVPAAPQPCPICSWVRTGKDSYCLDCGYCFPATADAPAVTVRPVAGASRPPANVDPRISTVRVKERYELLEEVRTQGGTTRFRALDHGRGDAPVPVTVVRGGSADIVEAIPIAEAVPTAAALESGDGEYVPVFDFPLSGEEVPQALPAGPEWPSIEWEEAVLKTAGHPGLPEVLDSFVEYGIPYLVEEVPSGCPLWDAWDDPDSTASCRFTWLKQVAEALHALHGADCIFEGIRPDVIVIDESGRARLKDLSDLLPLPVPSDAALRGTPYTAPELLSTPRDADARADLYSFGGLLYALNEGRELNELDFERGSPKSFILRYPESHPLLARLMTKTFTRDLSWRFPSDEAVKEDATGFTELIHVLDTCSRVLDNVRLDIASWTTTGIVRTGNEDGFALLHAVEARQDDLGESALIVLADGMGGYEGGEVAAAMAVQSMRRLLLQQKPFAHLAAGTPFLADKYGADSTARKPIDVEAMKQLFATAIKETNRQIFAASRAPGGKRGMGCTLEVVFVDGRHVVVGHVGDSRTYHYHEGRLIQLTRDQTLVNRLVELGRLTPEEAEKHEQRNQLSQAVGGQPDVAPGVYHGEMKPGDCVVVCSDGLTNHTSPEYLADMLKTESAEIAARRLINSVLLEGATDNATVVLVRAT